MEYADCVSRATVVILVLIAMGVTGFSVWFTLGINSAIGKPIEKNPAQGGEK